MKVVIINKSDSTGGAAIVSRRLMDALREHGVDASMLVVEKLSDSPHVYRAASSRAIHHAFIAERLRIFFANGFNRADLFKVDSASDGLPLWRHPLVREADIICLNWVNQGMLSLDGLRRLKALGKPIVWTMHDLWCMTGICHHSGSCRAFRLQCGDCHLLGKKAAPHDLSHRVWRKKKSIYSPTGFHFVAVSQWLADRAASSSLLRRLPVSVIPNAFPVDSFSLGHGSNDGKLRIIIGAARLDDPIKGFPILVETMHALARLHPEIAARTILTTFGNIRDPKPLEDIPVSHNHLGLISSPQTLNKAYGEADIVLSTSIYETLPGTLIEGQACGCYPIAFDHGGQRDIISHPDTGILIEFTDYIPEAATRFANAIAQAAGTIVTDNKATDTTTKPVKQLRRKLRQTVKEKFSSQAVANAYLELFDSLR